MQARARIHTRGSHMPSAQKARSLMLVHRMLFQAQTRDDYKGPMLGPKMAEKNERQFTEAQMREAQNVVSLQYGSNKGANQSGINMGKPRSILD